MSDGVSVSSSPLKMFGCTCFVYFPKQHQDNLDLKTMKCIFVHYSSTQKRVCDLPGKSRERFVTIDATFDANNAYYSTQWKKFMMLTTKGGVIDKRKISPLDQSVYPPSLLKKVFKKTRQPKKSQKIQVIKDSIEAIAGVLLQENEN